MCSLAASGRYVIRFHRARVGLHADAVCSNETRPVHMVNEIDVLDDTDLRAGTLEQRDALGGLVVARRIEHPVEQHLAVISKHRMHLGRHLLRVRVVAAGQLLRFRPK